MWKTNLLTLLEARCDLAKANIVSMSGAMMLPVIKLLQRVKFFE